MKKEFFKIYILIVDVLDLRADLFKWGVYCFSPSSTECNYHTNWKLYTLALKLEKKISQARTC